VTQQEDPRDGLLTVLVVPRPLCVGLVSAIVTNGDVSFRTYGESGDPQKLLDEDALLDIGSITKVFTGVLLAEMVQRGGVSLDDPLTKYLPEGSQVPSQAGRQITLVDLATHTAGLPRLPPNFMSSEKFDPKNPYAHFDDKQLLEGLAQSQLDGRLGETVSYSNFGFELLGLALGRAADSSYADLVKERICEPLGLKATEVWAEERQDGRLVPGHDDMGERAPFWNTPVAGDGGIVSSALDLAAFVKANIDGVSGTIGDAIEEAKRARVSEAEGRSIGLGWAIDTGKKGVRYHWHNGGVAGYGSFMALEADKKVGVVLLANSHHSNAVDQAGVRLLDRLCDVH
jgi:D-alanyl-D-alanine-carboxypeptidase/D-alanyl-D-alanine-endopeptidase